MKSKNPILRRLYEYGVITLGCALYALCFNWCFQPNNISMGGFTGVAQIINHFCPTFPIGVTAIVLNIPLFYLGVRRQGVRLLVSSLYAMSVGSLMIDALAAIYTFQPMEPLLGCIYGGVMLGVSMGLMLSVGATTGGTELAARLLKYKLRQAVTVIRILIRRMIFLPDWFTAGTQGSRCIGHETIMKSME